MQASGSSSPDEERILSRFLGQSDGSLRMRSLRPKDQRANSASFFEGCTTAITYIIDEAMSISFGLQSPDTGFALSEFTSLHK
jgi:hypothetical protein